MEAKLVLNNLYLQNNKTFKDLKNNVVNRKPYIGISYRKLKVIAKEISRINAIEFLRTNDFSVYELEILQTYVIGSLKDISVSLQHFDAFVPFAKEWSVVDSLCQKFIIARKHPEIVLEYLRLYKEIDDEYVQRIVAVMILSHFLNDNYIHQSIKMLLELKNEGYFCKMAVAWSFATIMSKYPELCFDVLRKNLLDRWTHNKSIQKMLESLRISEENKIILREMKL